MISSQITNRIFFYFAYITRCKSIFGSVFLKKKQLKDVVKEQLNFVSCNFGLT